MTPTEMAIEFLAQFAERAAEEETKAYQRFRAFTMAADRLEEIRWAGIEENWRRKGVIV